MGEMPSFQLGVIGALFLSVASSVSIVICNKALMSNLGFPFATTLTSWHLMVTFCTLHAAQRLNLFESSLNGLYSLWNSKWGFYRTSQLESWIQFYWILPDDQTCNHTIHCPIGNSVPEKAIQPEDKAFTLCIACWSWHCLCD
uniref:Sugar phosphate transporter domain-containing protein n=1 Tax=Salix viminalis TaxID=40686 RepID=A0A6N2KVS1_SALVM